MAPITRARVSSLRDEPDWQPNSGTAGFRETMQKLCTERFRDAPTIVLPRKGHVYTGGRTGRDVFIVRSGQIKTLAVAATGKRCLLSIYVGGDVFGEMGLLGQQRTETAVALSRSVLCQVPAQRFLSVLSEHGRLEQLLAHLGQRVLNQQNIIVDMVTLESERRLAARLLLLAQHIGARDGYRLHIDARITQEELAEMVGTTRSRVGYFLKRFRQAGLVDVRHRAMAVHEQRLSAFVEDGDESMMLNCG